MKNVAIFCGGNAGIRLEYVAAAKKLVDTLVAANIGIIYGGGRTGMMGAIADHMGVLGGHIVGVLPQFLAERELGHCDITEMHIVDSMAERKRRIFELADGFIMLPGGVGTLDEFFEAVTYAQLGLHTKPCGILNAENYYDHVMQFLEMAQGEGFVDKESKEQIIVTEDPQVLLNGFINYQSPQDYRYGLKTA